MKAGCPYLFCSASLKVLRIPDPPPGVISPDTGFIYPTHNIQHSVLTGVCPASLLPWPIRQGTEEEDVLKGRAVEDEKRIREWAIAVEKLPIPSDEPAESQSLRGPHRLGREPVAKQDEASWGLGGREDEDIQKEPKWHKVPNWIQGEGVGKVSLQETAAALNEAEAKCNEGRAEVSDCIEKLQSALGAVTESRQMVQGAKGNVESETLNMYIGFLIGAENHINTAIADLEQTSANLGGAVEKGQEFNSRLYS